MLKQKSYLSLRSASSKNSLEPSRDGDHGPYGHNSSRINTMKKPLPGRTTKSPNLIISTT